MLRVLLPTDFSTSSRNAVKYAFGMFKNDATYELLNVIYYDNSNPDDAFLKDIHKQTHQKFDALLEHIKQETGFIPTAVKCHIAQGIPVTEVINAHAANWKADMIVMAATGVADNNHILFGSHTAALISSAPIPVISVPRHISFSGIKSIVYATDFSDTDFGGQALIALAKVFNAHVHFLHVFPEVINASNFSPELIAQDLKRKYNYKHITFDAVMSNRIEPAIASFIESHKPDLLAMLSHNRNLLEKFFEKSITNEVAYQVNVPLLAFKKSEG